MRFLEDTSVGVLFGAAFLIVVLIIGGIVELFMRNPLGGVLAVVIVFLAWLIGVGYRVVFEGD